MFSNYPTKYHLILTAELAKIRGYSARLSGIICFIIQHIDSKAQSHSVKMPFGCHVFVVFQSVESLVTVFIQKKIEKQLKIDL